MTDASIVQEAISPSFSEELLSLLGKHASTLTLPARERAATAFIRSLEWMQDNPHAWEIKHVQPITYINQLDKPQKLIVRGRVVDIYKAVTLTGNN
ncbi:hypothetical protein K7459_12860 [Pseudomonas fluorescens]|uniref:hypothetical protein n=1 Tax=Pseudomonas fluorescens TaxID=294 RepID=UPI00059EBEE6|nr:hypothetical protein [Pseudomonas fluorescens]MBY9024557.1 hypothetical protein [Pseudomonas fluorescens]MBY9030928.1 hypothetical protein [Pseudomonas fluorescens]MBY9036931.1 hypothetical protein [Pseudomonas fluorescens]MBY9043037.1 hypothetical protein [Pseudomonas fluorescens]MBY9048457.1 hypothetical protein [Pseudomonas fluorescens]